MRANGAAKGANLILMPLQEPERAVVARIGSNCAQECYG